MRKNIRYTGNYELEDKKVILEYVDKEGNIYYQIYLLENPYFANDHGECVDDSELEICR